MVSLIREDGQFEQVRWSVLAGKMVSLSREDGLFEQVRWSF